ncbi:MAG: hypothetical protein ACERKD_18090 [Prolixibacteraceae bacterium]
MKKFLFLITIFIVLQQNIWAQKNCQSGSIHTPKGTIDGFIKNCEESKIKNGIEFKTSEDGGYIRDFPIDSIGIKINN